MADSTWTGAVNNDWNTAGNWSAGVPGAGDTATIPGAGAAITGNLTLVSQIVLLAGSRTLTGDTATGGLVLNAAAGATLTLSGALSGLGGVITIGPGTVTLAGSNTFDGGAVVNAGTLTAGNVNAFGTGTVTLDVGTLNLGGFAVLNDIIANGGAITGGNAFAGNVNIPAATTFTIPVGAVLAGTATVSPTGKLAVAGQHTGTIDNSGEVEVDNATAANPPVNGYTGNCGSTYAVQQP